MKLTKVFLLFLLCLAVMATIGCVPTPQSQSVINKGTGDLEELIKSSELSVNGEIQQYDIMAHWDEVIKLTERVTLHFDADIAFEPAYYPVGRMRKRLIDIEDNKELLSYFFPDEDIYTRSQVATKAELQKDLLAIKRGKYFDGDYIPYDGQEADIIELEQKILSAPDDINYELLSIEKLGSGDQYIGYLLHTPSTIVIKGRIDGTSFHFLTGSIQTEDVVICGGALTGEPAGTTLNNLQITKEDAIKIEQVNHYIDVFFGDQKSKLIQQRNEATKSELGTYIMSLEQMKAFGTEQDIESIDARIAELRNLIPNAPDEVVMTTYDGAFQTEEIFDSFGKLKGTSPYIRAWIPESNGGYLFVQNSDTLSEDLHMEDEDGGYTRPHVSSARLHYYVQNRPSYSRNGAVVIEQAQEVPANIAQHLNLKPDDAKKQAETLIASLGVSQMKCMGMMLVTDGNVNWGYSLEYVPIIGEIGYASISGEIADTDAFTIDINFEHLTIIIDDSGVTSFDWDTPCQTSETIVGNANLLRFSQIDEIFQKMMVVKYEPYIEMYGCESMQIALRKVELAYVLLREQSTANCMLVPCWVFAGSKSTDAEANGADYAFFEQPLLIVNAIDGSIVDVAKGY